jgi:hypothetical protein
MTVHIKMKDELDTFPIDVTMERMVSELNLAQAQGKHFVLMRKPGGAERMISVLNISFADEEDTDPMWIG